MALAVSIKISFVILFFFGFLLSGLYSETLVMTTNKCSYTVWPAAISSSSWPLSTTGFTLKPGESNTVPVPDSWSGRLWGRTLCSHNVTTGNFSCVTGDCDSSIVECGGHNGAPPVTLVEFTLNATDGVDYFDVSLVNGFNLPVRVEPRSRRRIGAGICTATSCEEDLNQKCPVELKITKDGEGVVGCKSSSLFSEFFKSECPQAHVYAYDDHASSFTSCASADYYSITFCPKSSKSSKKKSGEKKKHKKDNTGNGSPASSLSVLSRRIAILIVKCVAIVFLIACLTCHRCRTWERNGRTRNGEIERSEMPIAETIHPGPNPQPSDVEMGDMPIDV